MGGTQYKSAPPFLTSHYDFFSRVSRRLDDGGSDATQFSTPEDYYRKQYFELIDTAVSAVTRRFDQPGMEL